MSAFDDQGERPGGAMGADPYRAGGQGLIDTSPLWDDDGQAYLVHAYANSRSGRSNIAVVNRMSPDGTKLIGDEVLAIDGRNNVYPTLEGPKFYKRNGWYYILAPVGGCGRAGRWPFARQARWGLRSQACAGTGFDEHQRPASGRMGGNTDRRKLVHALSDRGGYGRVVHLNPVRWVDDWPLMGEDYDKNGVGEPVATYKKRTSADLADRSAADQR